MDFDKASEFFEEKFQLFGSNPRIQTERYNLYSGLVILTKNLSGLQNRLERIEQRLINIELKLEKKY
jgi:hypothetical protein